MTKYMNTKQAAEYLATTPKRIQRLCYEGRLPVKREGTRLLFLLSDLEKLVK